MSHGGSRPGAGRPKGAKNKVTLAREAAMAASGLTPLEYMLFVLNDGNAPDRERMRAAVRAAPYCHAKPRAVAANAGGRTVNVEIRRFSDERSLLQIDRDARAMQGEDAQAQPEGDAIDRLEAQWFNPDSQYVAHEPPPSPIPAPAPTPPPPTPAPILHEAKPADRAHGNGAHRPPPGNGAGPPQRMNGARRPQSGNGVGRRRSEEELRNIRGRPREIRDYPPTHPVHGIV